MPAPTQPTLNALGACLCACLCAIPGAAQAQTSVTLSGVIDLYAGWRQLAGASRLKVAHSGGMTTSRWSLDGAEALDGGQKVIFGLSGFLRVDSGEAGRNGADGLWRRYSFLGLQGPWGTLRLGRVVTPTFGLAIRFSPLGDSSAFGPYMAHVYTGGQPLVTPLSVPDSAADNAIAYTSPERAGFSATALASAGETVGQGHRIVWGATQVAGALALGLGGEHVRSPAALPAGVSRITNVQAGATWDLPAARLYGTWSTSEMTLATGTRALDTWQLGLSAPLGAGRLLLAHARTGKTEAGTDKVQRATTSLAYDHGLSRRTDVYLVAMRDTVTGLSAGRTLAAGLRHRY